MKDLTRRERLTRSLYKPFRKTIWTPFMAAVLRYGLIREGDTVSLPEETGADTVLIGTLLRQLQAHGRTAFRLAEPGEAADCVAVTGCLSDAAERTVTGLLREGRLVSLLPMERLGGTRIIRPLYRIPREEIDAWAAYNGLPPVPVPEDARASAALLRSLRPVCPDIEKNVFAAVHQVDTDTFPQTEE